MLHQCAHFMELRLENVYRKKSVPSEKPNMRYHMQMTRVREGTPWIWISHGEKPCHFRFGPPGPVRWPPKKEKVSYKTLCRFMAHIGSALDPTMDLHRAMIPNSFQLSFSMTFACATEIQFSFVIWSSWKFWSWIDCSVHCQINL